MSRSSRQAGLEIFDAIVQTGDELREAWKSGILVIVVAVVAVVLIQYHILGIEMTADDFLLGNCPASDVVVGSLG